MEKLINVLFPPKCLFCGAVGDVFCDSCISTCSILSSQRCLICDGVSLDGNTHPWCLKRNVLRDVSSGSSERYPSQFLSVFEYKDIVRDCIRKSKYSSRMFMCIKRLSFEAVNIIYEWNYSFKDYIVVPIPISKSKEKLRGYNQSDIISKSFSKRFNLDMNKSILSRIKDKSAQHNLTRKERFENISESFVSNYNVFGKKILLVDDICTSGATFLEASKVLYDSDATDVKCFSLSKKLL